MVRLHWPRQRPRLIAKPIELGLMIMFEVVAVNLDRDRCKFSIGSVHILLVSVSGSVNEPLLRETSADRFRKI